MLHEAFFAHYGWKKLREKAVGKGATIIFQPVEIGGNFVARLDLPFDDVVWCRCVFANTFLFRR